jgi:peptidyl-dipeptidase Dcp
VLAPQILRFFVDGQGHPIPEALVDKLKRSTTFNRGFMDTEFLASAIVDMKLHMSPRPEKDLAAVEAALYDAGMPRQIVMRHRIPQFGHLFAGGDGYAAGYYGYQWAEVLDRDAFEAFVESGNLFDPATARRLVDTLFAVGNSVDPGEAFRAFRGRDARVDATLRAHGFAVPDK